MAKANTRKVSPIKGVTLAQIRKVSDAMGITNSIENTATNWGIYSVVLAHSCAYLTASGAFEVGKAIAAAFSGESGETIAAKINGVPRIQPYTPTGGLAAQFASGKATAKHFGKNLTGLHSYHPVNFVGRKYVAALGAKHENLAVTLACEAHGIPTFGSTSENAKGAKYADNKGCNADCRLGLQIGDTLAVRAIAGKAQPKQVKPKAAKRSKGSKATKPATPRTRTRRTPAKVSEASPIETTTETPVLPV